MFTGKQTRVYRRALMWVTNFIDIGLWVSVASRSDFIDEYCRRLVFDIQIVYSCLCGRIQLVDALVIKKDENITRITSFFNSRADRLDFI